jgi:hypothetical protein
MELICIFMCYRPADEEPVPRGYIVKAEESTLTIEELMSWMGEQLASRMQLRGGAAFIDAIPISNVSRPCLAPLIFWLTLDLQVGNSKVDRQRLCEMAERELQLGEFKLIG